MTVVQSVQPVPARNQWMERWGDPALDQPGASVFIAALLIHSLFTGLLSINDIAPWGAIALTGALLVLSSEPHVSAELQRTGSG